MKEKKYERIAKNLKLLFRKDKFTYGQQIPTEYALMKEYQASRTTVRRALQLLDEQQFIRRSQGAGTFFCREEETSSANHQTRGLIGLVNYYYLDYIYGEIVRGIEDTLSRAGYSLLLANSNENEEKQVHIIQSMIEQGVQGLILEPSRNLMMEEDHEILQLLEETDIAVVNTHWAVKHFNGSTVTLDDYRGGFQAAEYLIKKGHRDLAIIYKADLQAGSDRFQGFIKAAENYGIPLNRIFSRSYTQEDEKGNPHIAYSLTEEVLRKKEGHPSAIFYMNDRLAIEGYEAVNDAGLSIPYDISILGFDDYETADMVQPGLTTFIHPKYHLGKWAARLLVDLLETDPPRNPVSMTFSPQLKERGSVREL